jgi:hypothetical protein
MTSCGKSRFNVLQSILTACILLSALQSNAQTIVHPSDASISEQQATKELRRYIFLRTGTAPPLAMADNYSSLPAGDVIVVSANAKSKSISGKSPILKKCPSLNNSHSTV